MSKIITEDQKIKRW